MHWWISLLNIQSNSASQSKDSTLLGWVGSIFNLLSLLAFVAILLWVSILIILGIWEGNREGLWFWLIFAGWFCYQIFIIRQTIAIQLGKIAAGIRVPLYWAGILAWYFLLLLVAFGVEDIPPVGHGG
ncbi:MAG: hypothetical protein H6574_24585 [Lewinellaceae bacterium]|nr:hypothetical protein [Lewinellaceae bacterium]